MRLLKILLFNLALALGFLTALVLSAYWLSDDSDYLRDGGDYGVLLSADSGLDDGGDYGVLLNISGAGSATSCSRSARPHALPHAGQGFRSS
jgi:hypothetical protein